MLLRYLKIDNYPKGYLTISKRVNDKITTKELKEIFLQKIKKETTLKNYKNSLNIYKDILLYDEEFKSENTVFEIYLEVRNNFLKNFLDYNWSKKILEATEEIKKYRTMQEELTKLLNKEIKK